MKKIALILIAIITVFAGGILDAPSMTEGVTMAMSIPLVQSRNLFTKKLIATMMETVQPTAFLRSFFPTVTSLTKTVSIEVQRGTEKIAVDVIRGTNGNRNEFGLSTEKEYMPPLYWEYFTISDLAVYDAAIAGENPSAFSNMVRKAAEYMVMQRQKIERAIELQAAQVLQTGIVVLKNGDNIDYKRKAASLVDVNVGGDYWTVSTAKPLDNLEAGCKFLRQVGKSQGQVFDAIMGEKAWLAFQNNTQVRERADIRNFAMDSLRVGLRTSVGSTPLGLVDAGPYKIRLWSYPEFYDNTSGVSTAYINEGNVILLPENCQFVTSFAAVPQLLTGGGVARQQGEYLVSDYIDERAANHEAHIKSAPLCIPVSVDRIYTMKVVA